MSECNPKFRDTEQRFDHAAAMADTAIYDASGRPAGGATPAIGAGEMLGCYRLEKELGRGAMGAVCLGRDVRDGRTAAIKIMALPLEAGSDQRKELKKRFLHEAETAGRLDHAHIVTIYGAGEERGLVYIAMELLRGKDLSGAAGPARLLPLPTVLSIVARVAQALDHAHRRDVVHRDIKPANIMYEPDGDIVKVTDFGIAHIADLSQIGGMVPGTPSYMSPEQLSGGVIDGRSDLFSLGVTLYQLCCGHLPFQGNSRAQLMARIANAPPVDILVYHPALPASVAGVVGKALAKRPEGRYQTGAEMARVLHACAADIGRLPAAAAPTSGSVLS